MRIHDLTLHNVGPFDDAKIEFLTGEEGEVPVTFITGENGTGKTIVLDAIRGLFGRGYGHLERSIVRPNVPFRAEMTLDADGYTGQIHAFGAQEVEAENFVLQLAPVELAALPSDLERGVDECPNWVVDFWRPSLPTGGFRIDKLVAYDPTKYLIGSLDGHRRNAAITEIITFFDYLRSSDEPKERADGEHLYQMIKDIFRVSLLDDGEFTHVMRRLLTPMINQSGYLVPIGNLSSGNIHLAQHLVGLLAKMYSVHFLRNTPTEDIGMTPGLLLLDEAENQLHPRWQQRFLRDVLHIFPNLQIIATTHSPFIVASVPGAKVFVCRYDRGRKTCVIDDESRHYENKPIEEILLSPAFDGTQPFGPDIATLLDERKAAFERGDEVRRKEIEAELLTRNPNYFSYLEIEERMAALRRKAS